MLVEQGYHFDLITSVSANVSRLNSRGFFLPEELTQQLPQPLVKQIFIPTLEKTERAQLTHQERSRHKVSVRIKKEYKDQIKNLSILLIDDIVTTGETIKAHITSLQNAGVKNITVLVLARA